MSAKPGSPIIRAIFLVPLSLALWWFMLKTASLWLLRWLAWLPLVLFVAPSGLTPIRDDPQSRDWLCNVEVNTAAQNQQTGRMEHVDSIEISISPRDTAIFACGWFSYLGLAFAAFPSLRGQGKRLLMGLAIQTAINALAFSGYVYAVAYGTLINSPGTIDARIWWIKYFDHINSLVVPFFVPFVLAMFMYPEWRQCAGLQQAPPRGVSRK